MHYWKYFEIIIILIVNIGIPVFIVMGLLGFFRETSKRKDASTWNKMIHWIVMILLIGFYILCWWYWLMLSSMLFDNASFGINTATLTFLTINIIPFILFLALLRQLIKK
jgi:hypothetical protein